jgi:hypothetical protein
MTCKALSVPYDQLRPAERKAECKTLCHYTNPGLKLVRGRHSSFCVHEEANFMGQSLVSDTEGMQDPHTKHAKKHHDGMPSHPFLPSDALYDYERRIFWTSWLSSKRDTFLLREAKHGFTKEKRGGGGWRPGGSRS